MTTASTTSSPPQALAGKTSSKASPTSSTTKFSATPVTEDFSAELISQLNKEHKDKIAFNLGTDSAPTDIKRWISTGSRQLDYIISNKWGGGLPEGRIIEISAEPGKGKSHLAYHAAKATQALGGIVVYIDTENATSLENLQSLGVDVSRRFVFIQTACTEEVFKTAEAAILKARAMTADIPVLVVWDSVAATSPKAELEGDYDQNSVGLNARVIGKGMRKIVNIIGSEKVVFLIINQTRIKVGVCFRGDQVVHLADGTTRRIDKIVNGKQSVEVLSYDPETGNVVPRKVTGWFDNGLASEPFTRVRCEGGNNGVNQFVVTKNHVVFTSSGEQEVKDLKVGGDILCQDVEMWSPDQMDLIFGSILGDGSLRFEKGGWKGKLRMLHGPKQAAYCSWKASVMGVPLSTDKRDRSWFETEPTAQLRVFRGISKKKGLKCVPQEWVEKLTPFSAAIWYQDDGTFSGSYKRWGHGKCEIACTLLKLENLERFADKFEQLGMGRPTVREGKGFSWSGEESEKFQRAVRPFIHPSMAYKVKNQEGLVEYKLVTQPPRLTAYPATILAIQETPLKPRQRKRFDLEVEGTHSYLAGGGGLVVHNSYGDPTTTPGGMAIPFACSVRIRLQGGKHIENPKTKQVSGISVTAKTIKNKVGMPFRDCEFNIIFGKGIEEHEQLFDVMRQRCDQEKNNLVKSLDGKWLLGVEGTGAWKSFQVIDAETGVTLVEPIKFYKPEFGTKVLDKPEFADYIRALMDLVFIMKVGETTHPTNRGLESDDDVVGQGG